MTWRIHQGDSLAVLRTLPNESIQMVCTSPPYWGLRDYGVPKSVWGGDVACEHQWGDSILQNATNHTDKRRWNHTRNGRDEEQPIEKRVAWLRTQVDQGNICQLCGAWRGALGLEPTPEMFVEHIVTVFREVRRVLRKDGTLWLNLGDSYNANGRDGHGTRDGCKQGTNRASANGDDHCRPTAPNLKAKDLVGIPWMVAFALRADGWWLRQDIIWSKPNPMPESVTDRCTKAHEYLFLLTKSATYYYDAEAIAEAASQPEGEPEKVAQHKQSELGHGTGGTLGTNCGATTRNRRSVWTVATSPFPEAHFATFPPKLVEPCILAGCPEDGTVLDPFSGAGTTGLVALRLGRKYIGIDLNPEYVEMSKRRIEQDAPLFNAREQPTLGEVNAR